MKIPVFTVRPYVEKLCGSKLRKLHAIWGQSTAFAEVDERQILGFIYCTDVPARTFAQATRHARAFDVGEIPLPPAADTGIPVGFVGPIPGLCIQPPLTCA